MLGPIDYIEVAFEGNNFDGSILTELSKAVDSGAIRVVDLVFITKDNDGNTTATELEDQAEELKGIASLYNIDVDAPMLSADDVQKLADIMEDNTSVGVLVIEHLWAKGLKSAIKDAGGVLLAQGRISEEDVEAVEIELSQN
jgi:hypothetical protein